MLPITTPCEADNRCPGNKGHVTDWGRELLFTLTALLAEVSESGNAAKTHLSLKISVHVYLWVY